MNAARVDVCFFIYNNVSENCLQVLKNLDYPRELLNVRVFSDRDIQHEYEHIVTPLKNAYRYMQIGAKGEYVWAIHGDYIVTHPATLKNLIKVNAEVVSGLLVKPDTLFTNFWGKLSSTGWYDRSDDYVDIVSRSKIGAYPVPYITGNILFKNDVFKSVSDLTREQHDWDFDMNICHNLREHNIPMYILNTEVYGHIEDTNIAKEYGPLAPWTEETALHPEFLKFLQAFYKDRDSVKTDIFKELGPDIWQFPFFTEQFCDHLIAMAEEKNEWSSGAYTKKGAIDPRIGAVENHPTQDIHLKQLNLHDFWLNKVVGQYFKAVLSHLYNYKTKGYNIAFIVKYSEDGQTKLDPHHDASAYTTNIALNTYGVDYTGGGCNFLHKKVECIGNLKGYLIMHPGRITHYHEAYPVQTGTRYILVSFND